MLHIIDSLTDPLLDLIKDDPVRPEIPREFRVQDLQRVFVLLDHSTDTVLPQPSAVVCTALRSEIPRSVPDLFLPVAGSVNTVVFYTIWSYQPGAGRRLITEARQWLSQHRPEITRFVTLSPPTEMAQRFHLSNGARVEHSNGDTVNYLYP